MKDINDTYIAAPSNVPKGFDWVKWTPELRFAWDEITGGKHEIVTILGQGGSGKSVLLEMLYAREPQKTLVVAPTGIAAFRLIQDKVQATTIHSAFGFRSSIWIDPIRLKARGVELLTNINTLLVDEISMVDCNMMEAILQYVAVAGRKYGKRIQVVLFGDIYQLPPVASGSRHPKTKDLWLDRYGEGIMFYHAPNYRFSDHINIELTAVHRQDSPIFRGILERMRLGKSTLDDIRLLNTHVFDADSFRNTIGRYGMMYLAGTNSLVDLMNSDYASRFRILKYEHHTYTAVEEGEATIEDFRMPEKDVVIYKGMAVMCIANERDEGDRMIYQNGTVGEITGFDDGLPVMRTKDGRQFRVEYHNFIKTVPEIDEDGKVKMKEVGVVTQIGCRPAYAVTFHKSQGLTLDAVYIDTTGWIAPGSVYLGLSRLRSESGLGLMRPLRLSDIKLSEETTDFYELESIAAVPDGYKAL